MPLFCISVEGVLHTICLVVIALLVEYLAY